MGRIGVRGGNPIIWVALPSHEENSQPLFTMSRDRMGLPANRGGHWPYQATGRSQSGRGICTVLISRQPMSTSRRHTQGDLDTGTPVTGGGWTAPLAVLSIGGQGQWVTQKTFFATPVMKVLYVEKKCNLFQPTYLNVRFQCVRLVVFWDNVWYVVTDVSKKPAINFTVKNSEAPNL